MRNIQMLTSFITNGESMKRITYIIFITSLLLSANVFADSSKKNEVAKLLDAMNMEDNYQVLIPQMLDIQLQQAPRMAPYKGIMLKFFSKYMTYESLKTDMIDIYTEAFTLQELKDINAFYQTPTGKKTITKMPELMCKGVQLTASRVQENIAELQQMIKAEAERIQQLQSNES